LIGRLGNRQNSGSGRGDRFSDKAEIILPSAEIRQERWDEAAMNFDSILKMHLRKTNDRISTKSLASDPETMPL
jgi:hypothetical protein